MTKTMIVKIKRKFTSPLTGRRTEVDQEINVPKSQFWFKRLKEKDCELIKKFTKAKPGKESGSKAGVKSSSKGSK